MNRYVRLNKMCHVNIKVQTFNKKYYKAINQIYYYKHF